MTGNDYGGMIGAQYHSKSGLDLIRGELAIIMRTLSELLPLSAYNIKKLLVYVLLHFTLGGENISANRT